MLSRVLKSTSLRPLSRAASWTQTYHDRMTKDLKEIDPELYKLINKEAKRIKESICLIASENFTPRAVLQATSSVFINKYSEGYPGARYYAGCQVVDELELLTQKRALEAFRLDPEEWGVNVQSLCGSSANHHVYYGVAGLGARILALELSHGGVSQSLKSI